MIPLQQFGKICLRSIKGMRTEETTKVGVGSIKAVVLGGGQCPQLIVGHSKLRQELDRLLVKGGVRRNSV